MNRLAIVSLCLALLAGGLDFMGWVGQWSTLAKFALFFGLTLFIVSAAAGALRTKPPA